MHCVGVTLDLEWRERKKQKQSWWDFKKIWDNFVSGLYQVNIENLKQSDGLFVDWSMFSVVKEMPTNIWWSSYGFEILGFQGFGMKAFNQVTITNVKEIGAPLNSFIPKYKIGWLLIERDVNLGFL